MKKIILFDIGRVLIDWNPDKLLDKIMPADLPQDENTRIRNLIKNWNSEWDRTSFEDSMPKTMRKYPEYSGLISDYRKHWITSLGQPIQGTVKLMEQLKDAGHTLYAASNYAADNFELSQKEGRLPFLKHFDGMQISGYVNLIKPEAAFFYRLMDTFQFDPQDALFVDDMADNIEAAQKIGIHGIQFKSPSQLEVELRLKGYLS